MLKETSNDFPLQHLPTVLGDIVRNFNTVRNFPVPYVTASMLYAVSVAIGSTVKLDFPTFNGIYANIIIALVGERGTNKSAPMREILTPLQNVDAANIKHYNEEVERLEAQGTGPGGATKKPSTRRLIVSDITTETLCQKLEENPRGLGLSVDELMSWIGGFDRYRKKSTGVDETFFLSLFNGSQIINERKSSSKIICIQRPYLSIIGSIQPSVLSRAITTERMENGMFDRLLIARYEEDISPSWAKQGNQDNFGASLWSDIILRLYYTSLKYEQESPGVAKSMKCIPKAQEYIINWRDAQEEDNSLNATEDVAAVFKKSQLYCLKIVVLINYLRYACGEIDDPMSVDLTTAVNATAITDWFFNNSKNFIMENMKITLNETQERFVENLPERFKTSQAVEIGGRFLMKERTVKLFLKKQKGILFRRLSHGYYCKL